MTHAEQDARDAAYMADLRAAPRCNGIDTLEPVALVLRRIVVKHFPHMAKGFTDSGYKL